MLAPQFMQFAQQGIPIYQHGPTLARKNLSARFSLVPGETPWRGLAVRPIMVFLTSNLLASMLRAALRFLSVTGMADAIRRAEQQIGVRSPMSLNARLEALQQRHTSLESRIFDEDHRPQPNTEALAKLKIEKLHIKDEMERIRSTPH